MSPRQPAECETMDQVRIEIDRIDGALVDLVAERFGFVERAWQLKTQPGGGRRCPGAFSRSSIKRAWPRKGKGAVARTCRGAVAADDRLVHPV